MKNKLKAVFTKKEKEAKVYDKVMDNYCNNTGTELTKEETEKLLDEITDMQMRWGQIMFGIGFAGMVVLGTIMVALDNGGDE